MPAPPPNGLSSIVRWTSVVWRRGSWQRRSTSPAARALPSRLSEQNPSTSAGKMLKTSMRMGPRAYGRQIHAGPMRPATQLVSTGAVGSARNACIITVWHSPRPVTPCPLAGNSANVARSSRAGNRLGARRRGDRVEAPGQDECGYRRDDRIVEALRRRGHVPLDARRCVAHRDRRAHPVLRLGEERLVSGAPPRPGRRCRRSRTSAPSRRPDP